MHFALASSALILGLSLAAAPLVPVSFRMTGRPPLVAAGGASAGAEFGGESLADGERFVFFLSTASNLVPYDGNGPVLDLYRRDRAKGLTELISLTTEGVAGRRPVLGFSASAAADRIAFVWGGNDAAAGDTNDVEDVYVRDVSTGSTRLVSVRADRKGSGNGLSTAPAISSDGRYVVFESRATDLVDGDDSNRAEDIFVRDLHLDTTERISVDSTGAVGQRSSRQPQISADGSVVLFRSESTNFAPLLGWSTDLMVWTRDTRSLVRITVPGNALGSQVSALLAENPVLSPDGRYLAFFVSALSPVPVVYSGVWWMDLSTGETLRASGTAVVPSGAFDGEPSMSRDGRTLAFTIGDGSSAGGSYRVRIWNPATGMKSMEELSQAAPPASSEPASSFRAVLSAEGTSLLLMSDDPVPDGGEGAGVPVRLYHRDLASGRTRLISGGTNPWSGELSADGGTVLWESSDPVIETGDENEDSDVVLTRVDTGGRELISVALAGDGVSMASGASLGGGGFSDDGQRYAYLSTAPDLADHDTNGTLDAFVYHANPPTNHLVSVGTESSDAVGGVREVVLARDGNHAAFVTRVPGVTPGDHNAVADVFVRDLQAGTTVLASAADGSDASLDQEASDVRLSADGRWVAFRARTSAPLPSATSLVLRDLQTRRTTIINERRRTGQGVSASAFELSADGRTILFSNDLRKWFLHRSDRENLEVIGDGLAGAWMSADGQTIAYLPVAAGQTGLFLTRVGSGGPRKVLETPLDRIRDLALNADGTVLAYARRLDPLSPAFGNPWQVFTYSVASGAETLVSADGTGKPGTGDSRGPRMSADGRVLVFQSYAENLVAGDSNGFQDVFSFDRTRGVLSLLSLGSGGVPGNQGASRGEVSGDGRAAAFTGFASNLVPADSNGLGDVFRSEVSFGPFVDADGDGLPDFWEQDHFGSLAETANGDPDGDGMNNAAEYAARTMPTDPTSQWKVVAAGDSAHAGLEWSGHPGVAYRVQWRETLGGAGGWTPVGDLNPGYEGTMRAALPESVSGGFFRVVAE
ncbi:MAG: hypothetical protein U1G08_08840 [Verrucomicrobiota bacterium]